jgi:cellulose synthase/poly-beta-1,6-N-acetylglucosamine synthase-like glycosyltransferase
MEIQTVTRGGETAVGALRPRSVAVLIACKNGEATIGNAVRSAVDQADVFVVSDGSTDRTVEEARAAGARVLPLRPSLGKPGALRAGNQAFGLSRRYDYVAVLDDDTTLAPDYMERLTQKLDADESIAVASGRINSVWDHARRWNPLIAMRAFTYWSYQATIKRGQNALRVVNVICGANSVFRARVFEQLISSDAPYAIDDMYWLAEVVRQRLGRIEYVHAARSWTIDPHRFGDWYRQTVRWSWGQFQSVRGHRLGLPLQPGARRFTLRFSWFDTAYLLLLVDWLGYAAEPFLIVPIAYFFRGWIDPFWFPVLYLAFSGGWILLAAAALRKWRLVVLAPVILALDIVYRVTMLHAVVKTIVRPRIETCRWDSPTRFEVDQADARRAA